MKRQAWARAILIMLMAWLPLSAIASPALPVCQTQSAESFVLSTEAVPVMECKHCAMSCSQNESMACQPGQGCNTCIPSLVATFAVFYTDRLRAYSVPSWSYPISHIAELLERPPSIG